MSDEDSGPGVPSAQKPRSGSSPLHRVTNEPNKAFTEVAREHTIPENELKSPLLDPTQCESAGMARSGRAS